MEHTARHQQAVPAAGVRGPTALLRLQSDERLVALTRRGNQAAYEALVARYQSRLLAFCRNMLHSHEDAEDVLQEVFAAAFSAMVADDRPLNVRPWLYRIARNRSLNHLRRQTAIGVDSMDVHLADNGASTADRVHEREELRSVLGDVRELAETQRTALLLREVDALSYEQIAEAMDTTVPAVKSLLVRARVGLAEAAEARRLTCDEVRAELGEWAEGLRKISPPARRHIKDCERCAGFRSQLKDTNKALAALFPVGPLLLIQKLVVSHGASASGAAGAAGSAAAVGGGAGGILGAGLSTALSKAVAGVAAVAIVTTGAVEVERVQQRSRGIHQVPLAVSPAAVASPAQATRTTVREPAADPVVLAAKPQTATAARKPPAVTAEKARVAEQHPATTTPEKAAKSTQTTTTNTAEPATRTPPAAAAPAVTSTTVASTTGSTSVSSGEQPVQVDSSTAQMPAQTSPVPVSPAPAPATGSAPAPTAAAPTAEVPVTPTETVPATTPAPNRDPSGADITVTTGTSP